ncbi:MAG: TatD family deoxyribonuclease [Bacteroidetes bacterium]|nr:TatD family deoxyribonuclease [Bacteroidota bacterium]
MFLIDSHTHLYLDPFHDDRHDMVKRAVQAEVRYMLLPNIDSTSVQGMLELCSVFPENCFPMMGLHPTSVKENFRDELKQVDEWLDRQKFYAIGETGIDMHWDKTRLKEQETAFVHQIGLAKKYKLPIIIHSRNSFDEIFSVLGGRTDNDLIGVFHCFTGTLVQAEKIIEMGFLLGIGGVVTFKNSGLDEVVEKIGLEHIILETDAPFLAPVPFRGKRNESAYTRIIAEKISQITQIPLSQVAEITSANAKKLFKIPIQ